MIVLLSQKLWIFIDFNQFCDIILNGMPIITKIREVLLDFKYAKIFQIIAVYFALIYHASFLLAFGLMKVYPMFLYNIYSVLLFSILAVLVFSKHSFEIQFIFFYIEVVVHQLLADYFLGGMTSFHFFIFLVGILPLLTFRKHFKLAAFYSLFSAILFTILEVRSPYILPRYELSEHAVIIIKTINIASDVIVNMVGLLMYSYLVLLVEKKLRTQVEIKTYEAQAKTEKLLKIQNYVINSLANLVDNRDFDTGEHIQRTSAYVELIAKKALEKGLFKEEIDSNFVEYIKRAAPLHDVGKIVVSDVILKKPGRLTAEEYNEMKLHAKEGGRVIREVFAMSDDKAFIQIAADVASFHHEKWDGSGYPKGLRETQIPLCARIMAVADVFDALVSRRCYKEAYPVETAYKIIEESAGAHFDPAVVELFLSEKEEIEKVMSKFTR